LLPSPAFLWAPSFWHILPLEASQPCCVSDFPMSLLWFLTSGYFYLCVWGTGKKHVVEVRWLSVIPLPNESRRREIGLHVLKFQTSEAGSLSSSEEVDENCGQCLTPA
jgi:hypothetical protein